MTHKAKDGLRFFIQDHKNHRIDTSLLFLP